MIRIYVATSLIISLLLLLFIAFAITLGARLPQNSVLAGLEWCDVPCWYGIIPGTTTRQQAWRIMLDNDYRMANDATSLSSYYPPSHESCDVQLYYRGDIVSQISLTNCVNVTMGDLMSITGAPGGVVRMLAAEGIMLLYSEGSIASLPTPGVWSPGWTSPYEERLGSIHIIATSDRLRARAFPWHGFVARWRYCQLEPTMPGCER